MNGITVGDTYYIRIYTHNFYNALYYANNFDLSITTVPSILYNHDCARAISLLVNPTFQIENPVFGHTFIATANNIFHDYAGSGGDDDVWYSFVATSEDHLVHVMYNY